MTFLTVIFTALLVLDCLFLVLLILVQLPKKEAGAGVAFGGAATDALFGAGSGTALTKITKYAAGIFFVLTIVLAILSGSAKNRSALQEKLNERAGKATPTTTAPQTAAPLTTQPTPTTAPSTPAVTAPPPVEAPATPSETPATPPADSAPSPDADKNATTPK